MSFRASAQAYLCTFTTSFYRGSIRESGSSEGRISGQRQYLVQAFLAMNDAYDVVFASHHLARAAREQVAAKIPSLSRSNSWPVLALAPPAGALVEHAS